MPGTMFTGNFGAARLDDVLVLAFMAGTYAGFKVRRLRTRLKDQDAWRKMVGQIRELHREGLVEPVNRTGGAFWAWTDKGRARLRELGLLPHTIQ